MFTVRPSRNYLGLKPKARNFKCKFKVKLKEAQKGALDPRKDPLHSVSFSQIHSGDEMHAKVTSHETVICTFRD